MCQTNNAIPPVSFQNNSYHTLIHVRSNEHIKTHQARGLLTDGWTASGADSDLHKCNNTAISLAATSHMLFNSPAPLKKMPEDTHLSGLRLNSKLNDIKCAIRWVSILLVPRGAPHRSSKVARKFCTCDSAPWTVSGQLPGH